MYKTIWLVFQNPVIIFQWVSLFTYPIKMPHISLPHTFMIQLRLLILYMHECIIMHVGAHVAT